MSGFERFKRVEAAARPAPASAATTTDREALAEEITLTLRDARNPRDVPTLMEERAGRDLATWLADRDRATAARTLREAAEGVIGCEHSATMDWCRVCDEWRDDLLNRADRIEATR